MEDEIRENSIPAPVRRRGPRGLGEESVRVLGERAQAGPGIGGLEEGAVLEALFRDHARFHPLIGSAYGWRHLDEGIVVVVAKPDNFIKTIVGILPIDLLLTQIFPLN